MKKKKNIDVLKCGIGKVINFNNKRQIKFLETQFDDVFQSFEKKITHLEFLYHKVSNIKIV